MNRKQRRVAARQDEQLETFDHSPWAQDMLVRGLNFHKAGDAAQAERYYSEILQRVPDHANALHLMAMACHHQGRSREALPYLQRALAKEPNFAEGFSNLGNIYMALGEAEEAENALRKAVSLKPGFLDAQNNLGNVLRMMQRYPEALACYEAVLALDPNRAETYCNMGVVLQEQGKYTEALQALKTSATLDSTSPLAFNNMGIVYFLMGKFKDAETAYQQAVILDSNYAEAYSNMAIVQKRQLKFKEALENFERAVELKPQFLDAHSNLALLYRDLGREEDARRSYQAALAVAHEPLIALREAVLVPSVVRSADDMNTFRDGLVQRIEALGAKGGVIADPIMRGGFTLFDLAYHGLNDLPLNAAVGRYLTQVCPALSYEAPYLKDHKPGERIKVGILSAFLYDHTISKLILGLVEKLPRDRFEVVLLNASETRDSVTKHMEAKADRAVQVTRSLRAAQEMVANEKLDMLFYPDIGMDSVTYMLAFSRLAPVQCVGWGHPVTTGLPTIDYFISSELIEPQGAEAHYSEKLVKFKELPSYYYRPQFPEKRYTRYSVMDLPKTETIYLCPQSLFKLHPRFDAVLGKLLRRDPEARLVLIAGYYTSWTEAIKERFQRAFPEEANRVVFIPRVNSTDFLGLLTLADAVLDPPYFGGGNTSYEALGVSVPIVTWPGEFMRGRVTAGCYLRMGVTDLIADNEEQYIELAYRLAHDEAWRDEIKAKLTMQSGVIYENPAVIDEFAAFFSEAVKPSM